MADRSTPDRGGRRHGRPPRHAETRTGAVAPRAAPRRVDRDGRGGRGCCSPRRSSVLGVLLLCPLVRVFRSRSRTSACASSVRGGAPCIGLDNYGELLEDPLLWKTVLPNTVVFAVVAVALTVVFGTLVALLLARLGPWARGIVTSAIMVAWAVPAVTGTYVWVLHLRPAPRPVDAGCSTRSAWPTPTPPTGSTDRLPFYAIAALNVVHHGFPFVAITVLAGLMTCRRRSLEAATMDGAGAWRRFWYVTVPMLKPVFAVVTILSTIWDFKVFAQIYLMPGGDGTNREVLNLGVWSYVESFAQNRYGLGRRHRRAAHRGAAGDHGVLPPRRLQEGGDLMSHTSRARTTRPGRRRRRLVVVLVFTLFPVVLMVVDRPRPRGPTTARAPCCRRVHARQLRVRARRGRLRDVPAQLAASSRSPPCWPAACSRCSPRSRSRASASGSAPRCW